jgi:hypothetical protein
MSDIHQILEEKIFGWVKEGQTVHQITEKGGYF